MKQIIVIYGLVAFLTAFLLITGIRGIDYGRHFDEHALIKNVSITMETGLLLPRWYRYPSVAYMITLQGIIPDVLYYLSNSSMDIKKMNLKSLVQVVNSHRFKLRLRIIFLCVTLASIIWIFLFTYKWSENLIESMLSSLILGASWELMYHARWVTPDCILMQFSILAMYFMYLGIHSKKYHKTFLILASITVGFCCGTKYPGGVLIVPLFLSNYFARQKHTKTKNKESKSDYLSIGAIFCISFIISTPGFLLEPLRFFQDLNYVMLKYRSGHGGYTVNSKIEHASLMIKYLAFVSFSKYWYISLAFFVFTCMGGYYILRYEKQFAIWFLSAPLIYILYFSTQKVMVVRNLLILFPFISILSAKGISFFFQSLPKNLYKIIFSGFVALMLVVNLVWLVVSAEKIHNRKFINHQKNIISYLGNHPDQNFLLSKNVKTLLDNQSGYFSNVVNDAKKADYIIFSSSDIVKWVKYIANRRGLYKVVSGIYEVNLDYYPSWRGDLRILATDVKTGKQLGVL
ncbi:glycosyltransferase family 39 protein [Desulfococcaceae bacterium HSG7]|nr:glycosyltransferase family 39 protein [Desulfococcaceae bacterium HSG7]